jgi:hypothetical protein
LGGVVFMKNTEQEGSVFLSNYLSTNNISGQKIRESNIKKRFFNIYNEIIFHNEKHFNNVGWKQKVYNYLNNVTKPIICNNPTCGNPVGFRDQGNKYQDYCSNKCAQLSPEVIERKKTTTRKNWGVDFPMSSEVIRKKSKETMLSTYGVDNPSKVDVVIEKKKETSIKKFGVDNHSKTEIFREHMKNKHKESVLLSFSKKLNIDINNLEISVDGLVVVDSYCKKHNKFVISKDNIYNRVNLKHENICTICNPISDNSSIKEKEINGFITDVLEIETKKIKIDNFEIDIFLPEHNVGVEHNGIYWHSEDFKTKKYHQNKTDLCIKNGIKLIQVFEDEWVNKKEVVKSVIKSKLNIYDEKIFGRKCVVKELTNKEYKEFLDENHLQGAIAAKIKIGLFYEDILVSIMSFGKKRLAMGNKTFGDNDYEMLRFCNKLNTTVYGGASRLLKYFIKKYNPKTILTFADRRYSDGALYEKLGFKFIGNTEPNYFYAHKKEYKRYHRFGFRKDVLVSDGFDPNKTEKEIMRERGYYRIYDCGNMKFEMVID